VNRVTEILIVSKELVHFGVRVIVRLVHLMLASGDVGGRCTHSRDYPLLEQCDRFIRLFQSVI